MAIEVVAPRLSVVEFWSADRRILAGVDLGHGRLTDLINGDDVLRVAPLDGQPQDRSVLISVRGDEAWTELSVAEELLILPPPQATDPQRRLHRPKQPVAIRIGPFVVSGMVHTPPGAQAASFLIRQNARFVPVTQALVRDSGLAGYEQRADVILVNMRRIDRIEDVAGGQPEPLPANEVSAPIA